MKCVHLDVVAPPGNRLAPGSEFQSGQVDDWSRWAMLARNPFRINQRQWPGIDRNRQARVKDFARRFGCVDAERDWPGSNVGFDGDELNVKKNKRENSQQRQTQFTIHFSKPRKRDYFKAL